MGKQEKTGEHALGLVGGLCLREEVGVQSRVLKTQINKTLKHHISPTKCHCPTHPLREQGMTISTERKTFGLGTNRWQRVPAPPTVY